MAENVNSVTKAFRELRELIVQGNLAPGGWVVESELAERLGVSRTPIRGALDWLRREGYIVEQTGKRRARVIVAPLTQDDARELYSIVGHLEVLAGNQLAGLPVRVRGKLADTLTRINAELSAVACGGRADLRRVFDIDKRFHMAIIDAGAGRRLAALHASVRPQVDRYWRLYASSIVNELGQSVAEHDEIVESVRKGDQSAVQRALSQNWNGGFERIRGLIEMFGERGSW
jgi:DNA-binding GntR family transcriptional regulator